MSAEKEISQELFETIEGYLNGSLPNSERLDFEILLKDDPALQQKVADIKNLLSGLETAVLKEKMNAFHEDFSQSLKITPTQQKKKPRKQWYYYIGVAASITLLAVLYFGSLQNNLAEKLFETHFQPDPGLPTTMGSTNDFSFYEAMVHYKKGDFKLAIAKWETLSQTTKGDTLTYFIGVAHLANANENLAIKYLKPLSQKPSNPFAQETDYYLGLAYLKSNDISNAKKLLASSGTKEALEILAKLND